MTVLTGQIKGAGLTRPGAGRNGSSPQRTYPVQCAVCNRIRVDGSWHGNAGDPSYLFYSHGYCPACLRTLMDEIEGRHAARPVASSCPG